MFAIAPLMLTTADAGSSRPAEVAARDFLLCYLPRQPLGPDAPGIEDLQAPQARRSRGEPCDAVSHGHRTLTCEYNPLAAL
jgi:hypothetical protein